MNNSWESPCDWNTYSANPLSVLPREWFTTKGNTTLLNPSQVFPITHLAFEAWFLSCFLRNIQCYPSTFTFNYLPLSSLSRLQSKKKIHYSIMNLILLFSINVKKKCLLGNKIWRARNNLQCVKKTAWTTKVALWRTQMKASSSSWLLRRKRLKLYTILLTFIEDKDIQTWKQSWCFAWLSPILWVNSS